MAVFGAELRLRRGLAAKMALFGAEMVPVGNFVTK
jgi:hypothetical protein